MLVWGGWGIALTALQSANGRILSVVTGSYGLKPTFRHSKSATVILCEFKLLLRTITVQLDVAPGFSLQPLARLNAVEITVDYNSSSTTEW
jgi:hypothetical protein